MSNFKVRSTRRFLPFALIVAALLALPLVARADNAINDVVVGGNDTFTAPGSTIVNYRINATGGDNQAGCNASDGSPATLTLSVPAGVSASTTSLVFTQCNTFKSVTFSASSAGNYAINVSSITDTGVGTYKNNADFVLHVNAAIVPTQTPTAIPTVPPTATPIPDSTPPDIAVNVNPASPDGSNGWYVSNASVSWTVTEPESPVTLVKTGCIDSVISSDTMGTTLSCSASSQGGSAGPVTVTIKRDTTAPDVSLVGGPADGGSYYFGSVPAAPTCDASDATSGVQGTCEVSGYGNTVGTHTVTASVVDNAGHNASVSHTYRVFDSTPPDISVNVSPASPDGSKGWYISNAAVNWTVIELESPSTLATTGCVDTMINSDTTGTTLSCSASSEGGSAGPVTVTIKRDATAPSVALVGGPADGGAYYFGYVPAAPTCTASDATSGVQGTCAVSGYGTTVGTHAVTASVVDNAGNHASVSRTYTVLTWTLKGFYQPVDMNGILNTVKGGSTVPLKFEVFAGTTELTATGTIQAVLSKQVTCNATSEDTVEVVSTGGTSLRYDAVAGQFIYNWQTPKLAGKCYSVTITTLDGSSITALFKLK